MNNNVLVIGGTGFVGHHLVSHLASKGFTVYALARNPENFGSQNVINIEGNISNATLLKRLINHCSIIIHAASDSVPGDTVNVPLCEAHNNFLPTVSLIENLHAFEHRHLIFISSGGAVYGNPPSNPVPEHAPFRPLSYHGACKASLELFLYTLTHQTNNRVTILRPSNLYGPGQRGKKDFGLIRVLLSKALRNSEITIWGDGTIEKDYLHVRDLVSACDRVLRHAHQEPYVTYNVGSGKGYSINAICDMIEEITGKTLTRTYESSRLVDPNRIMLNTDKIRRELGWAPTIGLHDGIKELWRLFAQER
jgi:UDP-glucose 4-epimerase